MANVITGRMKSIGVSLDEDELKTLRILAHGDRRSISWVLREAVRKYLTTRKDDVRSYKVRQAMERAAQEAELLRAQQWDQQIAQEFANEAAAAGIDLAGKDPASIIAAVGTEQDAFQDEAPASESAKRDADKGSK